MRDRFQAATRESQRLTREFEAVKTERIARFMKCYKHVDGEPAQPSQLSKASHAAKPGGQVARWPGGQVARRPGGQAARRPGGQAARQQVSHLASLGATGMFHLASVTPRLSRL